MKIAKKTILAKFGCSLLIIAFCACSPQEPEVVKEPDPGSPSLEAMSLIRYFFSRGGGGTIDTVPLSPGFNPKDLDYTAKHTRGFFAVIPEHKAPNAQVTVLFDGSPVTKAVWEDSLPHYSGYVMGLGRFDVTVKDTLEGKQRTYSILVQGE